MPDQPPLRFQTVRVDTIFFKKYLREDFKNSRFPMPEKIRKARNVSIILSFIEVICCGLSFGFYDIERGRIILALCVLNCVATAIGIFSKLRLSYWGLLAHSCWTISVIGGFYIYIIIDICLRTDKKMNGLSDTYVLLITSIPLFALFVMGIYSCVLVLMVDDELDQRKKILKAANQNRAEGLLNFSNQPVQAASGGNLVEFQPLPSQEGQTVRSDQESGPKSYTLDSLAKQEHIVEVLEIQDENDPNCVICMDKPKDSCFYPCGHQCLCFDCGERFKKEARHQVCPICRNRVKDIIKVYN